MATMRLPLRGLRGLRGRRHATAAVAVHRRIEPPILIGRYYGVSIIPRVCAYTKDQRVRGGTRRGESQVRCLT